MNKSEIAAKIKNAIGEKLFSIGAYVDKELPEYILVMIANKKSKESMAKDLLLFLGTDTNSFIEWLHELLEKCQKNPEEAFRPKVEKPLKVKANNSPDKKRKVDKEKLKVKSKTRKSDEKKDHKKSSLSKPSKNRSRSRSPKSESTPRGSDNKNQQTAIISEKIEVPIVKKREILQIIYEKNFINTSESVIERIKEDININSKSEIDESPKPIPIISSTVKVTERPPVKKELFKSSIEMVQRDLKCAEADITNKIESAVDKPPTQRSSVFTRLGNNDLRRSKLNESENIERTALKRTIHKMDSELNHDNDDTRQTKVKKIENTVASPNFIVTLKGADKLNIPLTSRLGPKRSQEMMDSIEDDEAYKIEINQAVLEEEFQESKENNDVVVDNQSTRCKFWPSCKNKAICPFIHPSEPCKAFPSCKFGANCLYIHPNCRFSTGCAKPDCPYTHYGPRLVANTKTAVAGHSVPRCLYYPNCTNVNCKFFHPNLPCKFGLSCKLKESCLFYHPSMPKMTDLKWTANQDSANTVAIATNNLIIDASSKKSEMQAV